MIRRLVVALALLLLLSGCAGSERNAVTVGELSISRAELTDLVVAINPGGPDELPATLSADAFRGIANTWTRDAALSQVLSDDGIVMTDDEQAEIDAQLALAVEAAEVGFLELDSAAYEAFRRNVWIGAKTDQFDVEDPRVVALRNSAEIESRLGVLDEATSLIVAS